MPGRSHARYLAPLSLIVFLLALVVVISTSGEDGAPQEDTAAPAESTRETAAGENEAETEPRRNSGPRTYRVRAGDTPSTIAEKTGVPLDELEELNPEIDPQQLSPGQRLRLRR